MNIRRLIATSVSILAAFLFPCAIALGSPVYLEIADFDDEGSVFDIPGGLEKPAQLGVRILPNDGIARQQETLGAIGPSGGIDRSEHTSNMFFFGRSTETLVPTNSIRISFRDFTIPSKIDFQGKLQAIGKLELLYDLIFLSDDLNDFGSGGTDFADDDRLTVTLDATGLSSLTLLDLDADEILANPNQLPLTIPPPTNSDPSESTGFEKRTGSALPSNPYIAAVHDVTGLMGRDGSLFFYLRDPEVGDLLESGVILDEVRFRATLVPDPSTIILLLSGTLWPVASRILRKSGKRAKLN